MGAISGLSTPASPAGLANPENQTVTLAAADTEQSFTFPNYTKHYKIFNSGTKILKYSFQSGESGTNYIPLFPNSFLEVYGINQQSVTIYLQSPGTIPVKFEIWK